MIEMFINRSCSHSLSIVIDVESSFSERDVIVDDLYPQLDLVVPLVSGWRTLFIHGSFYEDISDVCGPLAELYAPLLESFEVEINSEEDGEDYVDDHLQVFTAGAPRLSYLKMQGVSLESCLPPLTSLVSLRLHFPPKPLTHGQFRRTLTASNQLQNLHISRDVTKIYFSSRSPIIEIPSLPSLAVVSTLDVDLSSLLICLECPALEHLMVESPMYDIFPELKNVFRTTNGPSRYPFLQSLTLRYVEFIHWWDANWVVLKLPSITQIVIDSCNPKILLDRLLPFEHVGERDEDSDGSGLNSPGLRNRLQRRQCILQPQTLEVDFLNLQGGYNRRTNELPAEKGAAGELSLIFDDLNLLADYLHGLHNKFVNVGVHIRGDRGDLYNIGCDDFVWGERKLMVRSMTAWVPRRMSTGS